MTPRALAGSALAALVLVVGLSYCAGRQARQGEVAAAEERAARAAGALTAERLTKERLELAAEDLKEELARVREAVPGMRIKEVVKWRSAPLVAGGAPPATAPPTEACPTGEGPAECPDCLVPPGGVLDVRLTEARLESDAGAKALVAHAEIWRLAPPPETRLAEGELRADLSAWYTEETPARELPKPTRWAVAAEAGVSIDGPTYGASLERRVAGPLWAGVAAGSVGRTGYVAARLRWEW